MIVLKADKELNLTFQKLIKMMDAPVEWNGMFFVVGDYLILQGSVRSLFFNFDTESLDISPLSKRIKHHIQNIPNIWVLLHGSDHLLLCLQLDNIRHHKLRV